MTLQRFHLSLFVHSTKDTSSAFLSRKKFIKKSLVSVYNNPTINEKSKVPEYSESLTSNSNTSKREDDTLNVDSSKQSISDVLGSSSSLNNRINTFRQRTQLTNLFSLNFVQSSANYIYPNLRTISSGYYSNPNDPDAKNTMYMFSNALSRKKAVPLVFLGILIFVFFSSKILS